MNFFYFNRQEWEDDLKARRMNNEVEMIEFYKEEAIAQREYELWEAKQESLYDSLQWSDKDKITETEYYFGFKDSPRNYKLAFEYLDSYNFVKNKKRPKKY